MANYSESQKIKTTDKDPKAIRNCTSPRIHQKTKRLQLYLRCIMRQCDSNKSYLLECVLEFHQHMRDENHFLSNSLASGNRMTVSRSGPIGLSTSKYSIFKSPIRFLMRKQTLHFANPFLGVLMPSETPKSKSKIVFAQSFMTMRASNTLSKRLKNIVNK